MRYTGLMAKVYYKEVSFDLLYPVWFKKFILRIVRPVVTWVQSFKKNPGVGRIRIPPLIISINKTKQHAVVIK